jgi:hypothetical protein
MLEPKLLDRLAISFCLGSFFVPLFFGCATVANAENKSHSSREGLPLRRVGGGTRSDCNFASKDRLVALIPEHTVSKTTKANPKLYFYIPENTVGKQLEFVLRDKDDRQVYEITFTSNSQKSGIISVDLPTDQNVSLSLNERYHWYFSLLCDSNNRSQDIVLEGSIQRVELDAATNQKLESAAPLERANLYQKASIWQDAIDTLAELKFHSSETLASKKWQELLGSVGLADLAQKPLILERDRG